MPRFLKSPAFKDRPVLFIDLEMTGLDVSRHEIVEVAALLTAPPDFTVINSYYIKVNPVHLQTANSQALEIIATILKSGKTRFPYVKCFRNYPLLPRIVS